MCLIVSGMEEVRNGRVESNDIFAFCIGRSVDQESEPSWVRKSRLTSIYRVFILGGRDGPDGLRLVYRRRSRIKGSKKGELTR